MPDLDWDQLTYITASAEAKGRLQQDKERYVEQRASQKAQEQRLRELQQREQQQTSVNLAGLEALKRGFGLRGRHGSMANRAVEASSAAVNMRKAADSVLAASLVEDEQDLQLVTDEILARVRAQDLAEAELLGFELEPEGAVDQSAPSQDEVKYAYHYGHSRGLEAGEAVVPSGNEEPVPPPIQKRQRPRSSSRARSLVSLYIEEEEEEEVAGPPRRSHCPQGHGLERWTCRVEGAECEECGPFPLPRHSVLFGCRVCSWHLCSLHGAAAEPAARSQSRRPARAASPPRDRSKSREKASPLDEDVVNQVQEDVPERGRPLVQSTHSEPKTEEPASGPPARGQRLSYKERMKQRLEGAAKRREEGGQARRFEWAGTGEEASAQDAESVLDRVRQEAEEEAKARRPPSPHLELPEDFCPLCHQIETGAKRALTKGGHTFKAGCRRRKGA